MTSQGAKGNMSKRRGNPAVTSVGASTSTAPMAVGLPVAASDLASLFECPVCFDYVLPPILQCQSGHLVCSNCRPKLSCCPTCRGPLGNIRNLAMEKVASTVSFLCKYSTSGCNMSLLHTEKAEHEEVCEYRPYCCPCPGASCKWQGSLDQVMPHLLITHKSITTLQGEDIVFLVTDINLPGAVDWVMMQSCFGQNFMLVLEKQEKYSGHQQFFAIVQLIGSRKQAEVFAYRLELNGHRRRLTWEATPRSIHEGIASAILSSDCLVFDTSIVQLFEDNGNLGINVTISMVPEKVRDSWKESCAEESPIAATMMGCKYILPALLFGTLLVFVKGVDPLEKELNEKHFRDGVHNPDYDHEAFLGEASKTFDDLPPEESKKRLAIIVDKIDVNKDGNVSHHELQEWIRYTQQKYIRDNVDRTWKTYNPEGKELLSWDEYSKAVYDFMKDMDKQTLLKEEDGVSYQSLYDRDARRWFAADTNNDGNLAKDEFFAFLHPEETPRLRDLVVLETIESIDKDKDGKISLDEYAKDFFHGSEGEDQPEWQKDEIEEFKLHRDKNKDGFMDAEEVRDWLAPQEYDHADAEARHLMYEADTNHDQQLSKEEILDSYDVFVGSQATDFGNALLKHDEF